MAAVGAFVQQQLRDPGDLRGPQLQADRMPTASDVTVFETEKTSRRMSSIRRRSPCLPSSATT